MIPCPIPNCTEPVTGNKPMCVAHWRSVSICRQFVFYRALANLRNVRKPEKKQAAADQYWRARAEVVACVCGDAAK